MLLVAMLLFVDVARNDDVVAALVDDVVVGVCCGAVLRCWLCC